MRRVRNVVAVAGFGLLAVSVDATPESALPTMALYERFVAVDGACGWPLLVARGADEVGMFLWPNPSHGLSEGAVEFWMSADGARTWRRVGVPVPHQPTQNRMNHAGGVTADGRWVALVSGWDHRQPALGRNAQELRATAVPFAESSTLRPIPARSDDGGRTWQRFEPIPISPAHGNQGHVPYGRIGTLRSGALGVMLYRTNVEFFVSEDAGATWSLRGQLSEGGFSNETAWVQLRNGDLLAASRTAQDGRVVAYRSSDDGRSWQQQGDLTLPGQHPADLTLLPGGRVLLSYGVRTPGHWAVHLRWSDADGRNWSAPTVLVDLEGATDERFAELPARDGGYPSTVVLGDGTLATAYYSRGMPSHNRYHVGVVRWRPLKEER